MALAPLSDVNAGWGSSSLTSKPIAGHDAEASGGSSGQDDPAAAGALGLVSGPETGASPGSSGLPRTPADGHAGNAATEPTATAQ
jgi:hypothetical protein